MVYEKKGKEFILVNIPETGGDHIENLFDYFPPSQTQAHPSINNPKYRTISEYSKYFPLSNFFSFAFIRNPFERIISHYETYDTIDEGRYNQYPFEWFVEKHLKDSAYAEFLKPQIQSIIGKDRNKNDIKVNFVGRYEYIHRDWEIIRQRIGLPNILLPETLSDSFPNYREYYTPKLRKLVEEIYKQDLELFKYTF